MYSKRSFTDLYWFSVICLYWFIDLYWFRNGFIWTINMSSESMDGRIAASKGSKTYSSSLSLSLSCTQRPTRHYILPMRMGLASLSLFRAFRKIYLQQYMWEQQGSLTLQVATLFQSPPEHRDASHHGVPQFFSLQSWPICYGCHEMGRLDKEVR